MSSQEKPGSISSGEENAPTQDEQPSGPQKSARKSKRSGSGNSGRKVPDILKDLRSLSAPYVTSSANTLEWGWTYTAQGSSAKMNVTTFSLDGLDKESRIAITRFIKFVITTLNHPRSASKPKLSIDDGKLVVSFAKPDDKLDKEV